MDMKNRNSNCNEKQRREHLCCQILQNCRNELYSYFPYLDGAFASVSYEADQEIQTMGTDGHFFYYSMTFLMKQYMHNSASIRRGYLHMLLHCLYLHIFPEKELDRQRWNLACDIAVEQVIEKENLSALQLPENPVRKQVFQILGERSLSAQEIYRMLETQAFFFDEKELETAFLFDNHGLWDAVTEEESRAGLRKKWEKVLSYTGRNKNVQSRRRGTRKGTDQEQIDEIPKSRYDYRKFLKQFSVPREEVELDTESFDYVFYCYGMEHYGNMPLIEPLEYKEVNRLEELVIAIDTSSSCSREVVQQFLGETYEILSQRENFFRKMKVYIIQCDSFIQDVAVIHSEEEWKEYSKKITIQGRGGTDFCPVFRYIEEQKKAKEIQKLKALIYFTDGDGLYPQAKPDYETAFVFLKKTDKMDLVPPWATKLLITAT